jgi:NADH-quinone oxidoreductase subunit J
MITTIIFYVAFVMAVLTTGMVILSRSAVYAVLYFIMSLFSVAIIFHVLGAPFIALIEIIVYAGAIMVLFLFVIMMLNMGRAAPGTPDMARPSRGQMIVPGIFAAILFIEVLATMFHADFAPAVGYRLSAEAMGRALYNQHYLGVELASIVLLLGIIGGMHIGQGPGVHKSAEVGTDVAR